MAEPTSAAEAAERDTDGAFPLRKRPIPDQLDYFGEKLGAQLGVEGLPRDTAIAIAAAVAAAVVNLGAIATQVRALLAERDQLRVRLADIGELADKLHAAQARANAAKAVIASMQDDWLAYDADTRNAACDEANAADAPLCDAQDVWFAAAERYRTVRPADDSTREEGVGDG